MNKRSSMAGLKNHRFISKDDFQARIIEKFGADNPLTLVDYNGAWGFLRFRCNRCTKVTTLKIATDLLHRQQSCSCIRLRERCPITAWEEEFIEYLHIDQNFTCNQISQLLGIKYSYVLKYLRRGGLIQDCDELNSKRTAAEHKRNFSAVSLKDYAHYVGVVTNKIYSRYRGLLDTKNRRGVDYHLDHILSKVDAYMKYDKPLSLREVCHPANLRILKGVENCRKNRKSAYTLTKLRKKIKEFEIRYGAVDFPEHWMLDFENNKNNRVEGGISVLGLDPGTTNFGVFGGVLYGTRSLHRVRPSLSTMLKNPIKDLRTGEFQQEKFKQEIRELVLMTSPDFIVIERFQARGLRGTTGELISFMIGFIAGMLPELKEMVGHNIILKTPIAGQWKNALNRAVSLDAMYAQLKPKQFHRLDAALLSMSVFPAKNPYEGFSKTRQQKLLNLIQKGEKFPEGW